jgi:hypothetical protein
MKPKTLFVIISIFALLFSCSNPKEGSLPAIDLFVGQSDRKEVPISLFGSKIEYVLLETNKDCQLGEWARYYLDKDIIIAVDFRKILLFYRKDGKFIKQIGHWGKDPHGYAATKYTNEYDYRYKTVYAQGWDLFSYIGYSIDTDDDFTIKCPWGVSDFTLLTNNNILGYIKNFSGIASDRLTEFQLNDTTSIYRIPNFNSYLNTGSVALFSLQGWFYNFSKGTYFYELFTDTIFRYEKGHLGGHLKIDLGKLGQKYEMQSDRRFLMNQGDFIMLNSIYETQNFVFIKYVYHSISYFYGLYDKKNKVTRVTNSEKQFIPGYLNDIDGFVNFPLSSINPEDYAIGAIQAVNVVNWMDSTKNATPASIKNIKELNMSSNPLIMIVKLKK